MQNKRNLLTVTHYTTHPASPARWMRRHPDREFTGRLKCVGSSTFGNYLKGKSCTSLNNFARPIVATSRSHI